MAEIKKVHGRALVDYMSRDYDSLLAAMLSQIPYKLPEWKDYQSEADFGRVLLELFAHMGDILNYYLDRAANESFLETAQTRASVIQHLRLIGYTLSTAAPASASLTLTVPSMYNGTLTIKRGDAFATKSSKEKPSVRFEYNRDSDLSIDFRTIAPGPDGKKRYEHIPVEEGRLVRDEVLGTSNGTPNQRFMLAHPRLILRSTGLTSEAGTSRPTQDITITTLLDSKSQEWNRRETLAFSRASQHDYLLLIDDQDRTTVVFGDGAFGAIPPRGAEIRVTYRRGGGIIGNVPANAIQTIVDAPQLTQVGASITNPAAATGGDDRETIEQAVLLAPGVFRSLHRAVAAQDYEALALDFAGVGKVRARSLNWNRVVLYVAPQGGGLISDVLRARLLAYFEDKRPITTTIDVENVQYVNIYVTAHIGVKNYYDPVEVKASCQQAGANLLAFENVDFGRTIYLSKFYEVLETVDGVEYVNITEFRRLEGADAVQPEGKIELGSNEIPQAPRTPDPNHPQEPVYPAGINVTVEGEK